MIERIIDSSIRCRWQVIGAALALALLGLYAVEHTPVDAIPDLSENQVIVFADWSGHGPREIEDQLTYPLSRALQGLDGVRVVRSSSDFNFSMLSLIFEERVDVRIARQSVGQALSAANRLLPAGVTAYLAPESPATGQIFWYTIEGEGQDLSRLRAIQDWYVRGQLSAVPGVAEVASVGGAPLEFQIDVDPLRLQQFGLGLPAVLAEIGRSSGGIGGHVLQQGEFEYIVRARSAVGGDDDALPLDSARVRADLSAIVLPAGELGSVRLGDVATIGEGPAPRRGVLEKDGNEVTGGVISIRYGENPLEVTRRIVAKIDELQTGLPAGVRIVPVYDRTRLIHGAISTVTGTLLEAILAATVCVLVVLLHVRTTIVIALILPMATLCAFLAMWILRRLGIADIQTNVMSLAGIVVSIGVLVDVAIVMAENAMHALEQRFGDRPVVGDTRRIVSAACRNIGRPIFFSVLIMLLSFLPVFALEGAEGRMFRPLAATKSLALAAAALLSITLVPALCTIFIRGRLRNERQSWLVRSVMDVYRPTLDYLLSNPAILAWILSVSFVVATVPLAVPRLTPLVLGAGIVVVGLTARTTRTRWLAVAGLIVAALVADRHMSRIEHGTMTPLDEQMVMDMPISAPRASLLRATDDLKARDMILCRFPEVAMVVGKAGRAETPTDPAPVYMIETMVDFRPVEFWPQRKLSPAAARSQSASALDALAKRKLLTPPADGAAREALIETVTAASLARFDANLREFAYHNNQQFAREMAPELVRFTVARLVATLDRSGALSEKPAEHLADVIAQDIRPDLVKHFQTEPLLVDVKAVARQAISQLEERGLMAAVQNGFDAAPVGGQPTGELLAELFGYEPRTFHERLWDQAREQHAALWKKHIRRLNAEFVQRAGPLYTRLAIEECLRAGDVADADLGETMRAIDRWRWDPPAPAAELAEKPAEHHARRGGAPPPLHKWQSVFDALVTQLAPPFESRLILWRIERSQLTGFGGELDLALQMPGWTNVWTMPIQNRVDMLATGVNTAIGARVLGRNLEDVVRASEDVATALKRLPGAADVAADPVRGKGYLEIRVDRQKAAELGVSVGDLNQVVETAVGGSVVATAVAGRERHPIRVRYDRSWREDEQAIERLPVPARPPLASSSPDSPRTVALAEVADVQIAEGPATIKSENGLLRNYVRANVRGRSAADFVAEARQAVADQVQLPEGVYVEWTGQYEYELRSRRTLLWLTPLVVGLILLVLYWTYRDWADALLMLLAVPGALAGGVLFQWLCGYPFSVTVWVGYIACFGMASSTGIVMLVYLRDALARAGGIERVDLAGLRQAVLDGAVQRLRPKLLTEGTTIIGLAPMLWATGVGAEVIRPMAAPVLGGILIADEVIDLLLPVMFYWVRRWRWGRLQDQKLSGADSAAEHRTSTAEPVL